MDYSFTGEDVHPGVAASQGRKIENALPERRTSWPIGAIAIMQSILFLGHWLLFHTFTSFWALPPDVWRPLAAVLFGLSVSFTIASLLSFRYGNLAVAFLYRFAAMWLGMLNFLVWAACLSWAVDVFLHLTMPHAAVAVRPWIAVLLFGLAVVISLCGFVNARLIRQRRVTVGLANLPAAWEGRKALMVSDLHLGHVNGRGFAQRIAGLVRKLQPDIVFIPGDLFDGSRIDAHRATEPLFAMDVPLGVYFSEGNHEDYGDAAAYNRALRDSGIRVLTSEAVDVDGVRIIGVPYARTTAPVQHRTFLESLNLTPHTPSILLNHVPNLLGIAEKAGVSLQLSGHTHGGQVFPFTWFARRAFGQYIHGLNAFGRMQVLTSSGVGTWGPPMRVGSSPEVILITFTGQSSAPNSKQV
jgi:uncharacterized protein